MARSNKAISRRGFLLGTGGIALALPFLEKFATQATAAPSSGGPKRIIVVTYQMGVPGGVWRPSARGTGFNLPYVTAPLEPWRDRCIFVSDIDNTVLESGGQAYVHGHPAKTEAALTGSLTSNAFPANNSNRIDEVLVGADPLVNANAPSVEHIVGRALFTNQAFPSVDLGVDGDTYYNRPLGEQVSRFFFEGRDTPIRVQCDSAQAFNRYFAAVPDQGDPAAVAALRSLRERKKSVLDAVRDHYGNVASSLGADDRRRLEEHAARIRRIEIDAVAAGCSRPTGLSIALGERMDTIAAKQIRMLAQAMACDLAPVGRLEFCNQQDPRFGSATLDQTLDNAANYDWHAMVHGDPLPGTGAGDYLRPGRDQIVTTYDQRLQDGYRFFVQQFANLMNELNQFPEGNGTVLDNTMLILASDLGEGQGHHHGKMGYVVAGNLLGAKRNYHMSCATNSQQYTTSTFCVNQLLNSIADMAGGAAAGIPSEIGLQGYLQREGKPRRIDELFV